MLKHCYFDVNYNLRLFISFKMDYTYCYSSGVNLDFLDFLQKRFYNIDHRAQFRKQIEE